MVETKKKPTIEVNPHIYQPTKAEQEKEYDMPGADTKTIRGAFFQPYAVRRETEEE